MSKLNLLTYNQQRYSHKSVDYPDVNDVELLILLHYQQRSLDYHGVSNGTRTRDPEIKSFVLYQLSYEDKLVVLTGLQPVTWNLEDSYSDATELQNQIILWVKMDSNQQHLDLQSSALPLELFTQLINKLRISRKSC